MRVPSTVTVWMIGVLVLLGIAPPRHALSQAVIPFHIVGHIQRLTLDSPADPLSGAKLTVNGVEVVLPKNLVIQLPAAYFTAQQLFDKAQGVSKKYGESGLALSDKFPPLAAFEADVSGNIVNGLYIAGLVTISQQSLNTGAGFIHHIDTATGMMCVGGSPTAAACAGNDTRIRLNDPALDASDPFAGDGRYGKPNPAPPPVGLDDPNSRYPDPRFTVDQGNPTVHALTGYPMCVPRATNDAQCPSQNRPAELTFVMDSVDLVPPVKFGNNAIKACPSCDANKQAPVRVGDYITFSGTRARDPLAGDFLSVHTLVANVGIYTKPGGRAYVSLEESLLGTRGPVVDCGAAAECQDRLKVEGFTTDPSRRVSVYAVDVVPGGVPKVRLLHSTEKDQAVFGRFRYVPPLTAATLFDFNGNLKGATRELMVRIDDPAPLSDGSDVPSAPKAAHGLTAGIYVAPVGEYIFPEPTGVQGGAQPALNFQCLAFLANGWALPDSGLPNIPRLTPWPGVATPTFSCTQ
ncbi:MAG TPA: hypothetical protein PLY42_00010 [Nitrospira sp.]|nr:hypothetical protein [Nitrospira sp.]MBX7038684.1 hypothetical protein [Nitrospira sp.]MCW5793269.1 hypothetical protein [Nitrospira sp.]HMU30782.1 hypothetical protein [Nitrospira sp.]HMV58921.1 hypothetical protein [Nitrospira sp.]